MMAHTLFALLPNAGVVELLFLGFFIMVSLPVPIWGIIDAAMRPDWQWQAIGASRTGWIFLMAVYAFLCAPVGAVIALYYLVSLRRRFNAAVSKGSRGPAACDLDTTGQRLAGLNSVDAHLPDTNAPS